MNSQQRTKEMREMWDSYDLSCSNNSETVGGQYQS
jgi:hypothetical protein